MAPASQDVGTRDLEAALDRVNRTEKRVREILSEILTKHVVPSQPLAPAAS